MKNIYKQTIGITGASGTLGKYFIKKFKNFFIFKKYPGRIESISNLKKWLIQNTDIKIFLHFAAIASTIKAEKNKKRTFLINSQIPIKIIKFLNDNKIIKLDYFLFASTSHVYKPSYSPVSEKSIRKPVNVYGLSKKKVENFIIKNQKKLKFKVGVARIFNFSHSSQKNGFFITDINEKIRKSKKKIYLKNINTFRDFVNISCLCKIIKFMIDKKITGPLNIGSGLAINLVDLVFRLIKKNKKELFFSYDIKKKPGLIADIRKLKKNGYTNRIQTLNL